MLNPVRSTQDIIEVGLIQARRENFDLVSVVFYVILAT